MSPEQINGLRVSNKFNYRFEELINPTLGALHVLGGSGSIYEIEDQVAKDLKLSGSQVNEIHKGNRTKFGYRLAWARNYLKQYGLIENSSRGVWALTTKGTKTTSVEVQKLLKSISQKRRNSNLTNIDESNSVETEELGTIPWQEEVLEILKRLEPGAFERLCQRLLRELGFQNVIVSGKSNDGGIDGRGIVRLSGVLSFHVVFQAKRYKSSVSPSIVRDFRGAMIGRADKGLIITTGNFTREARKEAVRDGAPPVDLIDGYDLAEKLKALKLGVEIQIVEEVKVKKDWFESI